MHKRHSKECGHGELCSKQEASIHGTLSSKKLTVMRISYTLHSGGKKLLGLQERFTNYNYKMHMCYGETSASEGGQICRKRETGQCSSVKRVPRRLRCPNTSSPIPGAVCAGLGGVVSLKKVGRSFEASKACNLPCFLPLRPACGPSSEPSASAPATTAAACYHAALHD